MSKLMLVEMGNTMPGSIYKGLFTFFFAVLISLLPFYPFAQAQTDVITKKFETYHRELAPEKVYLHTNRERFTLGDTLYFGAFVLDGSSHSPTYISGVLYVDLISPKNNIIESHKLKIDSLGRTYGDFALSNDWAAGEYKLRAYTRYQMNFDQDYFFTKTIKVLPTLQNQEIVDQQFTKAPQIDLQLFPEGGELIAGISNKVAFKATDQYGNPLDITGKIIDDQGNEVADLECEHDGMGIFHLIPGENKNYTCVYQFAGATFSQPLPDALLSGYLLGARNTSGRWHIAVRPVNTTIEGSFLVMQCRGKIIDVFAPRRGGESIKFSIDEEEIPSGIIHITFF